MLLLRVLADEVRAQQLACTVARASGAEVEQPATYDEAIVRFDAVLSAPFTTGDDPDSELRDALGLNGR